MDKLEEILTHYVRVLLDATGRQAEAEAEIADAFAWARAEQKAQEKVFDKKIADLEKRLAAVERFISS